MGLIEGRRMMEIRKGAVDGDGINSTPVVEIKDKLERVKVSRTKRSEAIFILKRQQPLTFFYNAR